MWKLCLAMVLSVQSALDGIMEKSQYLTRTNLFRKAFTQIPTTLNRSIPGYGDIAEGNKKSKNLN